jgi:hypothetical protein
MTGLLAAVALAPAVYKFEPGPALNYTMKSEFNGFIPILGGNEGKVEVTLGVAVQGLAPKEEGPVVTSDINRFELKFNEAPLPFGLDSVRDFFPKATVGLSPAGKVLTNTTPDRQLPIALPGLDPRRLPDITFVPIELPTEPLEAGKTWTFERAFSGAPMKYEANVQSLDGDLARIGVKISQSLEVLENDALEVVKTEKDATARAATTLTGEGQVWFDLAKGRPEKISMRNNAVTKVTLLKGGATSERKLTTRFEILRDGFVLPAPSEPATPSTPPRGFLEGLWDTGRNWFQSGIAWVGTLKTMLSLILMQVPMLRPLVNQLFGG